jgi:single-stranded-DNA-specific exonuclease
MKSKKKWILGAEAPTQLRDEFATIPLPMIRVLFHRGIQTADEIRKFLDVGTDSFFDPFLFTDMTKAVERVLSAILHKEAIAIYGDYDADGVTATALLTGYLNGLGARVKPYIPNRMEEGYGLNCAALSALRDQGTSVVISVDCGARSPAEADHARSIGLDLIITDHHAPGEDEPKALAFLDAKRKGDAYPEKELAGVGVAYKFAQAIAYRMASQEPSGENPAQYLDMVALGTVADMVPLRGENRTLVKAGLASLNRVGTTGALRPGMEALLQSAGVKRGTVNASAIGYMLAPRLNATGRLETADCALHLLGATSRQQAEPYAMELNEWNRQRQQIAADTFHMARTILFGDATPSAQELPSLLMAEHAEFHPGIIGLAASKLLEEFYRPSIVVALEGEWARGSARSIPGFHITEALESVKPMLERFGGHAAAAGFTVRTDRLPELRAALTERADAQLTGKTMQSELNIDSEIALQELLRGDMFEWIKHIEPCGQGNPAPVFVSRKLSVLNKRTMGKDGKHLKLTLADGKRSVDAVAFGWGKQASSLPALLDVAYALEEDTYYEPKWQLRIIDMADAQESVSG